MHTQLSATRSLSSLTKDEGRALFALGFGYAPTDDTLKTCVVFDSVAISDGAKTLWLSSSGNLSAYDTDGASLSINARNVISNIDAMRVAFGPAL